MSRSRMTIAAACALLMGLVAAVVPSAASAAPLITSVTLTGDPVVGATLTAKPDPVLPLEVFEYRWQRCTTADQKSCDKITSAPDQNTHRMVRSACFN